MHATKWLTITTHVTQLLLILQIALFASDGRMFKCKYKITVELVITSYFSRLVQCHTDSSVVQHIAACCGEGDITYRTALRGARGTGSGVNAA